MKQKANDFAFKKVNCICFDMEAKIDTFKNAFWIQSTLFVTTFKIVQQISTKLFLYIAKGFRKCSPLVILIHSHNQFPDLNV